MAETPQPSVARRVAVMLAWFGLGASVLVHVASFLGVSLFEQFMFLHFGILLLGVPAALSGWGVRTRLKSARSAWNVILEGAPPWAGRALVLGWIYFGLNMVALFVLDEGGSPAVRDGRFILHSHGQLMRELTESEYRWQLSHVSRMFSAGWALAYTFFVIFYSAPRSTAHTPLGRSDSAA